MRRRVALIGFFATGLVLVAGCSSPSPVGAESTQTSGGLATEQLQSVLDASVEEGRVDGLTAAVASEGGTWAGAAGVDGAGAALVPTSGMAIASISKTFVAVEVLALVEEGSLALDEPIASYLPQQVQGNGATLGEVLEMRSGVRDVLGAAADALFAEALAEPERHWDPVEALSRASEVFAQPGMFYAYANVNYVMLGLAVEQASGTSLGKALRRDVVGDASLQRFAVQDEERLPDPLAAPGQDTAGVPRLAGSDYLPSRSIASLFWAGGGMAADAETVARWGYLVYGGRVLPTQAVEQMTDFDRDHYGLGTMELKQIAPGLVGHQGETEGYRSMLAYDPERDLSVAVLVPHRADPTFIVRELFAASGS